jgi:predicted polyphosphate/ATP-dependent NAD kinase
MDAGTIEVLAAPGEMGAELALGAGLAVTPTGDAVERPTTAADTRMAAVAMRESGVELLLFAGGDGTARDIYDAIGDELPLVGIPAGVKMHSGVFAPSPEAAAHAGETFLRLGTSARLRDADIADVDEHAAREGRVASILYGAARVPDLPRLVLPMKSGSRTNPSADLDALCRTVAADLAPDTLCLVGPGTTTAAVLTALGLSSTLLGVDAIRNGRLVEADLTEDQLVALLDRNDRSAHRDEVHLIVGLVGGQGVLFGRGNRQLMLDPTNLWVDTGDPELDTELAGYVRVHVGPRQQIVIKVSR